MLTTTPSNTPSNASSTQTRADADLVHKVVSRLAHALPRPAPLHEPSLGAREEALVQACVASGWVSYRGEFVDRFEQELADYTGSAAVLAVSSGTAALHLSLILAGVAPGEEVLVPALSFVATANAVRYCHAVPHFVDSDETTLGVDAGRLEAHLQTVTTRDKQGHLINTQTGRRIAACVVVHGFGHPADMDALVALSERWRLPLIEDAAASLGSFYKGKHTGTFGVAGALSFNGNKVITTGGGGAVLVQDAALAERAHHLSTTAKRAHPWAFEHDEVGFNYRLPSLNAALGCAQLEQLPNFLKYKRALASFYRDLFADLGEQFGVQSFVEPSGATSNYWLNVLLLPSEQAHLRDVILAGAHQQGILARPAWHLLSDLPMYRACPRMTLSTARSLESRILSLPSGPALAQQVLDA